MGACQSKMKVAVSGGVFNDSGFPTVRLIPFGVFKRLGQMPRCPENIDLLVNYEDTVREESLYIFISHCWLRGWPGAPGWDGRAHPDTRNHDKYQLMVASVEKIMKTLTTMSKCYIWLDFGCIDQDATACDELRMLDKIVGVCDVILTNVHDTQDWDFPSDGISNLFDDYKSPAWNSDDYAYLNRGWCRVEMLYAANIPLENDSAVRVNKFKAGLLSSALAGRRPHLLYGTKEHKGNRPSIQLPPMQNSWFDDYNPVKGKLTKESDRVNIQRLVDEIAPNVKRVTAGFEGDRNAAGRIHGQGVYRYADGTTHSGQWKEEKKNGRGVELHATGDEYVGEFKDDKKHGQGISRYSDGTFYDGEYKDGKKHGQGVYRHVDGVYCGEYKDNKKHGHGVLRFDSGAVFEGEFKDGKIHGRGVYLYANGDKYDGDWQDDQIHGLGVLRYADHSLYEGDFNDGKKHGRGVYRYADGDVYEGDFNDDKMHGRGVFRYADGSMYEGDWKDDNKDGQGLYQYADHSVYEGQFKLNKYHGQGLYRYACSNMYEGEFKDGYMHGIGEFYFANGEVYIGEFKQDKHHGRGLYTFADGDEYDGDFKDDKMHGRGVYRYSDGDVYQGDYEDDKMHGRGVFRYSNGVLYEGEYKDDKKHGQGMQRNADGAIIYRGQWNDGQPY